MYKQLLEGTRTSPIRSCKPLTGCFKPTAFFKSASQARTVHTTTWSPIPASEPSFPNGSPYGGGFEKCSGSRIAVVSRRKHEPKQKSRSVQKFQYAERSKQREVRRRESPFTIAENLELHRAIRQARGNLTPLIQFTSTLGDQRKIQAALNLSRDIHLGPRRTRLYHLIRHANSSSKTLAVSLLRITDPTINNIVLRLNFDLHETAVLFSQLIVNLRHRIPGSWVRRYDDDFVPEIRAIRRQFALLKNMVTKDLATVSPSMHARVPQCQARPMLDLVPHTEHSPHPNLKVSFALDALDFHRMKVSLAHLRLQQLALSRPTECLHEYHGSVLQSAVKTMQIVRQRVVQVRHSLKRLPIRSAALPSLYKYSDWIDEWLAEYWNMLERYNLVWHERIRRMSQHELRDRTQFILRQSRQVSEKTQAKADLYSDFLQERDRERVDSVARQTDSINLGFVDAEDDDFDEL